uniref:AIG1-type G domain-containing protein n=1 Tax=Pygocentrus nattereri TaxID=42514 RepID=A0AAR2LF13_PYGNA
MEIRAVVFGGKFSGKSFLINSLFGKDLVPNDKRTAQSKKLQGSVCGRKLTLVDTPGWWKHFPLSDTAEFLKRELVEGVSLCHPGPHVVLLVIEIDIPFTEKHRKAAEDHLQLLGDQIWTHMLVLFTRGHTLGERTIEEHIENEGEALKWLIERCGNRYHVFGNTALNDKSQVTQLLAEIEDIVERNNGTYFQIDTKILEKAAEWKKTVMTKAQSRVLKLQQKTHLNKELRIVLLGWVIAGKSSAGNTILNKTVFANDRSTVKCQSGCGEVDGRPVTVLDTPSWFKYFPSQYTPAWIKSEIFKGVCQTVTSPHCILLVIPADTSFKEDQKKVIQENMSLLGEQVWGHTIVLFTWGDILGDLTIEQHIESEGEALQWVVEKCENRYHVFNNEERENRVQVTELLQKIDEVVARNSLFQLNTQTSGRIHARQEEVDAQAQITDEHDLQDVVQFVDEEWRRRDKELLRRVSEVKKDIKAALPRRGDRSMDSPLELSRICLHTATDDHYDEEVPQTKLESGNVETVQNEAKSTLKLKCQIKEMLDREWSRREEALMGRFLELLSECRYEVLSEPTEEDKERSSQKVFDWFQGWSAAMFAMMAMMAMMPMMMPMMVSMSMSMVMSVMMLVVMSMAMMLIKGARNSISIPSMRPWAHWWIAGTPWWWRWIWHVVVRTSPRPWLLMSVRVHSDPILKQKSEHLFYTNI